MNGRKLSPPEPVDATRARAAQKAFVGLLARPLVTAFTDPVLHRAVTLGTEGVAAHARRLGYRIQTVGRAVRLVRVPVAGAVTAPPAPLDAPPRRVLTLACVLAAVCEDTDGAVTLQRLSDLVRDTTATAGAQIGAYDPDSLVQRRALVRAAILLEHWGVLRRRTADERLLDAWAESADGVGAGYVIDRDALLLLTTPDVLAAAFDGAEPRGHASGDADVWASTRTIRALRALVETPAVVYADMDPEDAAALVSTRGLRSNDVVAMTGAAVEARIEGMVLTMPDDEPCPVTVDWPRAAAGAWVSLLAADLAGRAGTRRDDGSVLLTEDEVEDVFVDLIDWRGAYMTHALKDPAACRGEAERQLVHLGLLRTPAGGGWVLSPVAARYRDPDILLPDLPSPEPHNSPGDPDTKTVNDTGVVHAAHDHLDGDWSNDEEPPR